MKRFLFFISSFLLSAFFLSSPSVTYAQTCANTPTSTNSVSYTVSIPETNTYTVWSRILAPDTSNNSFWLQIDGGCAINIGDSTTIPANTFIWLNYKDGTTSGTVTMNLSAGNHTVKVTEREGGVGFDKIIFTTDTACVPTGTGDNCPVAANTPTPTVSPLTATIETSPQTAGSAVNAPFTVDIVVNGGGTAFNAAQATVAVSPNLTVTSLASPSANACNFTYAGGSPSSSNPSFAGAILGTSKTQCTVYKLTLTPNAAGTGTVTLTNGSVKAFTDNTEILASVKNGTYSLTAAATPTPAPTTAPLTPTNTPVPTATIAPSPTPTRTPTPTPIPTATPTPTLLPTNIPLPTSVPITPPGFGTVKTPTYQASTILAGNKSSNVAKVVLNNLSDSITYATATSWQKSINLSLGSNVFQLYGEDSAGNKTTTDSITIVRNKLSDINGDNVITLTDVSLFSNDWLKTSNLLNVLSDMNEDGNVNLTDFSIIAKNYGQ